MRQTKWFSLDVTDAAGKVMVIAGPFPERVVAHREQCLRERTDARFAIVRRYVTTS